MADFGAPSFSLGLEYDLLDSEPQFSDVSPDSEPSSSNHFFVSPETLKHKDDDFETLIVDDSDPEYPDPRPKLKRLRRGPAIDTDEHHHSSSKLPVNPCVSNRCNIRKLYESIDLSTPEKPLEELRSEKSSLDFDDSLPPAIRYFFHNDLSIQELVRSRLPNFAPLNNTLNRDLDRPSTSDIDYIGQFSYSKQASDTKISRNSETEDTSQGWVNPKLGFDKRRTKETAKRKVNSARKTAGHWVTGPNGKKVYVGKKGEELTGVVAYMQYRKESGVGVKRTNRKYATKKKKK